MMAVELLWLSGLAHAGSMLTPAAYRAGLNAICRANTVKLHQIGAHLASARETGDAHAYAYAVGQYLGLGLGEDAVIEKTPVPPALRPVMTPVVRTLRKVDMHVRAVLLGLENGDSTTVQTEIKTVVAMSGSVNTVLDAAGLRDCGSNQS
jgi:hypothetical protein